MMNNQPPPIPSLVCRDIPIDLSRPCIMGILNVTPDSFSDGGLYGGMEKAVDRGIELAGQGADIIDVGGESTRPGAAPVPCDEELRRVIPVVEKLSRRVRVPISIDTTKAKVARRAIDAGAAIVNDVSALRFDPDMAAVVARSHAAVVLMHMRGNPQTMQENIRYDDLVGDIVAFLNERIAFAVASGIGRDKIIVDPGIGFGKSIHTDNFVILHRLKAFAGLGQPVLVGPSRKAFIGAVAGDSLQDRDWGTAAAVAIAVYNGAHIIRVHDVGRMRLATMIADAVRKEKAIGGDAWTVKKRPGLPTMF